MSRPRWLPRLQFSLRTLIIFVLLCGSGFSAEPDAKVWPLWDGQETLADYAQRVNLPPTKTLDLGNGVKLELVLIPAGEFVMGTPEPEPVDEDGFRRKILTAQVLLATSGGVLLVLVAAVVVQAIRRRRRPQYSLAVFIAMVVAAGGTVLSGMHWWRCGPALEEAKREYQAALIRYKDSWSDEKPAHKVTITTPFYIGKYEVTQQQYQQVTGANPSDFRITCPPRLLITNPVEMVSWNDAQDFCKKVSQSTGQSLRLPTEAEWEHACRAGTKTAYYSGETEWDLYRAGWYDRNSKSNTQPVGGKTPNVWGVYDMHGSVAEWCLDRYEPYNPEAQVDPQAAGQFPHRVARGGAWRSEPRYCRSAFRDNYDPDYHRTDDIGFRVVGGVAQESKR